MTTKTGALRDLLELNIRINVVKSLYADNPIGKDFVELFENMQQYLKAPIEYLKEQNES